VRVLDIEDRNFIHKAFFMLGFNRNDVLLAFLQCENQCGDDTLPDFERNIICDI
jgi:hypothetical protein